MIKKITIPVLLALIFLGCKKKENPVPPPIPPVDTVVGKLNNEHYSVLTQHNDNTRAGFDSKEAVLTTANVNSSSFGKLFNLTVDDQVYAQPLVYGNLAIASGTHNVVFIATTNNTVYAYDGTNGKLYWKKNFTVSGMRAPLASDMNSGWCTPYTDFAADIGIVGTPVIDSASKTMYFVARSTNGTQFIQYLHAINIVNGAEKAGSPVQIAASVSGTGDGSVGGMVSFDPRRNNQRQGLALVNGVVYISWSSHCDWNPYHGWIIGYNAGTLQQQIVYCDTPNGEAGGLWESGMGIAADAGGNLYVTSGNGTVGDDPFSASGNGTAPGSTNPNPSDVTNRGESAIKLTPNGSTLKVNSFFTPTSYYNMDNNDLDYGVMGTFLVPGTNDFLTGCKDGNLYLLNKDNMGGFSATGNAVLQTIPLNVSLHCQPAFYAGGLNTYMYVWSENDQLRAFSFSGGLFATNPTVSSDNGPTGGCGADLSVSSNGTIQGTGILWATYAISGDAGNTVSPGILRAFDAADITRELWNSSQSGGDFPGNYGKFCSPTIANGHVYLATFSQKVVVYGLK
ncbi:MAG TPA: PQQ-binding-like beta-propeller repeat protein [Mucilaginibacter sp.]|jgi:hypothetical protein|nr:PQQ-binding-like beta-propeller repeat protein [Mucilaginibacter sp.]